ncbi:hypothetical protein LTR78_009378 [Recurvomyces mirabilis]|uniref:Uncharacterized protein n=1 Tax=Recurvomyces mirabilis TaxID=574656 RepID=A0AAE0WFD6_9PEZI|nr:hypothetical protein LTR78_009378 [Recurvomyces mirabilis]KAK5154332.1 hypothetical protein LTS14_007017 [Recurvomyces mirabilis]
MSLAEAKLARQNARIQQAEAALTAPLIGKRSELDRGTLTQPAANKTSGIAAMTQNRKAPAYGASEPEVRINTFRAQPRDSSLSRSMSSLSQRTAATHVSDNTPLDNSGFQVFTGRRAKKLSGQLNAYEDKPEQKQTTVEAPVDTREIYEVFGNALPGTDYIQQNLGAKSGQLQFLQHPNGDVSAHQWSMDRFLWENIGQFSNIRKKTEGLLAADRLRGETAQQTLQHNSLAYFQAIAKQHEAMSMGQHFDAADMLGHLTRLNNDEGGVEGSAHDNARTEPGPTATPSESSQSAQTSYEVASSSQHHYGVPQQYHYPSYPPHEMPPAYTGYYHPAYGNYGSNYGFGYHTWQPGQMQYNSRADRYSNNFFGGRGLTPSHDSVYAQEAMRHIISEIPSHQVTYPSRAAHIASASQALNYDYHFPPVESTAQPCQPHNTRKASFQQAVEQHLAATITGSDTSRAPACGPPSDPHPRLPRNSGQSHAPPPPPTFRYNTDYATPSNVEAGNVRTKMREHLAKLSDQAKERSISQSNIRTVLHDPFRTEGEDTLPQIVSRPQPDKNTVLELKKTVANPSGLPPRLFESAGNEGAAQRLQTRSVESTAIAEIAKTHSSPESRWSRQETDVTPQISSGSRKLHGPSPRPEGYTGHTMEELTKYFEAKCLDEVAEQPTKKSYERRVNDWCLNGSTFARHEELFNTIKAADAAVEDVLPSKTPSLLAPIGTPARKDSTQDSVTVTAQQKCDAHTRMLIPVWENLASYVQGPAEKRRGYFSQWTQAPEWAIDHNDNTTFFDNNWGQPPLRIGWDPRYRQVQSESTPGGDVSDGGRQGVESVKFGGFSSPTAKVGDSLAVGAGSPGRFASGRM